MRVIALATLAAVIVIALIVTLGHAALPEAMHGSSYTGTWARVVLPCTVGLMLVALVVVADRLRTVTEIWLSVVVVAHTVAIVSGGELSSGRYSFGWYAGRVEALIAAVVVLAIFLVKINDRMCGSRRAAARPPKRSPSAKRATSRWPTSFRS